MAQPAVNAVVHKSVRVQAPIAHAFSVFTAQMDTWWPPSHHIGVQPFAAIVVEPRYGGRWFERDAQGNECDWGRVLAWDPPHLVTFSWHLQPDWKFDPDPARASEVLIRFTAEGSSSTLVELIQSGIERHGEGWEKLRDALDGPGAWADILAQYANKFH